MGRLIGRWIPTLWLAFVIARFAGAAMKTINSPYAEGDDIAWTRAWIAFLLIAVVSAALLKTRKLFSLWLGLSLTSTIVILILTHTWLAALVTILFLAIAAGCGEYILDRFLVSETGLIERLVITTPIGIGVIALVQLSIGLAGFFRPSTSWLMTLLLGIPAFWGIRSLYKLSFESELGADPIALLPILGIFFLNVLWAAAPEIQFDALSTHLAVPRIYLEQGGVVNLPYFMHSYFAHLLDLVFGVCLALGGQISAKFLVLALGLLAAGGVFVLGKNLFSPETGAWAALIFYSTPLVIWLSGTTYIDLAETCFVVAAVVAFVRWFQNGQTAWLVAAGCTAGVAIGTKLHALSLLAPIPLAIWIYSWRRKQNPARALIVYVVIALAIAAPWYALIYAYTGNPLFPFMNAVFQSPQWEIENTRLDADAFGIGSSTGSLIRLPFWLTWDTSRFGGGLPRGGVGFALLLVLPLAFVALARDSRFQSGVVIVLLCSITLHVFMWAFSFQYGRYFIPVVPLLCVLGCAIFCSDSPVFRWNRLLLFIGVVVQVPIAFVMFWNIPERFPLDYGLGKETADHLLSRSLMGYDAVKYINSVVKPGEAVLGIGLENVRFYLNAPLHTLAEASRGQELQRLGEVKPGPDLAAALTRLKIVYVITPRTDLEKPAAFYPWLQPDFVRRFEKEAYRDNQVAVLKICGLDCD